MRLAAGLTVLALLKSFVLGSFGYGLGSSFMIPEVEDVFSNNGPHDFEEIPFQHNVPELVVPNSKMRNLVLGGTPVGTSGFVQQQNVQMPFGQPTGFQPWATLPPPPPPPQPVQPQVMQPWQSSAPPPVQMQPSQAWQLTPAQPQTAQPWQGPATQQGMPTATQSWQQPSQNVQQPSGAIPQPSQPWQQPSPAPMPQPSQSWQQPSPAPVAQPSQSWQQSSPAPVAQPNQSWQQPSPAPVAQPSQSWQQPPPAPVAQPNLSWQQPSPAPVAQPNQSWQQPSPAPVAQPSQSWQQPSPAPVAQPNQSWQQPSPLPVAQPSQSWQQPSAPVAQPTQTLPPPQSWQQPQTPPTQAPVQASPPTPWQQPTPPVSPNLPPQQPTGQAWQQSPQSVQVQATSMKPSQDPRFLKYFPSSVSAPAVVDDLFGRSTIFPSSILRFGRYFSPVQPNVPTAPVAPPPAIKPTQKSSITNLQNFLSNSFSLSMIDTDSKKCDATATFTVGSKRYLVAFQNPNCQNMTWGGAANFCQSRGLATFSPTSSENAEAVTKIGSLLKPGLGFWTDGIVSRQNGKLPMVIWTVVGNDPVPVTPGEGLLSSTLFRSTDKPESEESCIGLFNNKNKDGIKLYDVVCNAALGVVCQSPF